MTNIITRAKGWARTAQDRSAKLASRAGLTQSEEVIADASRRLWRNPSTKNLAGNSHALGAGGLDADTWQEIGADAVERFWTASRALRWTGPMRTMLDYGCGHGAQATAFAPDLRELVAVDVQGPALAACHDNVAAVADTEAFSFVPVLIDNPEDVYPHVNMGHVDAFVSFYVFELIPGQQYGERILRMAFDVLRPGGIGFVQFKYPTSRWDETRRRGYSARNLADTTKYRPDEFWSMVERVGFTPGHITIEPSNALDGHYGYMSFTKPEDTP